jgi:hypothetical protein
MKIHALGIDLGKTVFHLVGLDAIGQVVVRKRCSRTPIRRLTRTWNTLGCLKIVINLIGITRTGVRLG